MSPSSNDPPPDLPAPRAIRSLRARLLAWYADEQRDLPWRRTRDPYAIWISEAMLQQTRVETVIPYWHRFLERFPDVRALAAAEEDELLAAWSGLGYYRRARSLAAAAQVIVERHGGRFPDDREAARALPGIGPYTAGAVLSIAYDRAEALVDGNVERVFARLFEIDAAAASPALKRRSWELAEVLVPQPRAPGAPDGPGAWNQALMELGATVCTPREPRCLFCPVRGSCRALASGRVAELPGPKAKPERIDVELEVLVVERRGRLLLARRPAEGRMANLWELPTREVASERLWPTVFPGGEGALAPVAGQEPLGEASHGITKHRIRALVREGQLDGRPRAPLRWFDDEAAGELGLTGLTRKILRALPRWRSSAR